MLQICLEQHVLYMLQRYTQLLLQTHIVLLFLRISASASIAWQNYLVSHKYQFFFHTPGSSPSETRVLYHNTCTCLFVPSAFLTCFSLVDAPRSRMATPGHLVHVSVIWTFQTPEQFATLWPMLNHPCPAMFLLPFCL